MKEWLIEFGYLAVFLGAIAEGETLILLAGGLAHQGYFSIWKILGLSFIGTLIADQVLFYLGLIHGERMMAKWPKIAAKTEKVFNFLRKYNTLYILSFRFFYGFRIVSPIIIGVAKVDPWVFAPLNILAAAIWAAIYCGIGYGVGHIGQEIISSLERGEGVPVWIYVAGGLVTLLLSGFIFWWRHKKRCSSPEKLS